MEANGTESNFYRICIDERLVRGALTGITELLYDLSTSETLPKEPEMQAAE